VLKATPTIAWTSPADIIYGTVLSGTQLNATASIPGSFVYTPPSGAVLNAGTGQTLHVVFTATSSNYNTVAKNVTINVLRAPLTVKANDQIKQYSDPMPQFTASYTGFVLGQGPSALGGSLVFSTLANPLSPPGNYIIAPGGLSSTNYAIAFQPGTLTVTQENGSLSYVGDSLVTLPSNSSTATVNLAALVQEEGDGYPGLTNAITASNTASNPIRVKFSIYKSTNTTMTTPDYTAIGAVSSTNNTATASLSLPADNYAVKLELQTNSYFVAPIEETAVTVVLSGTGMVTGGGWLIDPNNTNNPGGYRSNFGFTAKSQKNGNVQGSSLFVYRTRADLSAYGGPAGLRDYNFIVKSSSITSLQVTNTTVPQYGSFAGKCSITAVDRQSGATMGKGSGYLFQVDITDKGEPGSGVANPDTYAIRVYDSSGNLIIVGTYSATGVNTMQVNISGGNIQVH